jgi:hypothetical protein
MSGTMSAAVRYEDHFGPIVPDATPSETATSSGAPTGEHTTRLRDLAHQMRHCVARATAATDMATKVELWASYRAARAEALALLDSVAESANPRRLHSV